MFGNLAMALRHLEGVIDSNCALCTTGQGKYNKKPSWGSDINNLLNIKKNS